MSTSASWEEDRGGKDHEVGLKEKGWRSGKPIEVSLRKVVKACYRLLRLVRPNA